MEPKPATRRIQLWIPLIQCAWCRAVKVRDTYLHLPMLRLLSGEWHIAIPGLPPIVATLTHSVCSGCARNLNRRAQIRRSHRPPPRTQVDAHPEEVGQGR